MAKVLINDSTLSAIGDAIRYKTNSTNTFKPSEMPSAIRAIIVDGLDFQQFVRGEYTSLHIPYELSDEGVLDLKPYAFAGFEDLITLSFDEGITSIDNVDKNLVGGDIFYRAGARIKNGQQTGVTITFPSTLKNIGKSVFEDVCFKRLELPDGLETIGASAFLNQNNVGARAYPLNIPASVKTIGERAFQGVSLGNVYFKGTPQSLGKNVFQSTGATVYCPWEAGKGPTVEGASKVVYGYKEE